MNKLIEMQKNVKAIVRKHENNLIKLNVEVWRSIENYDNYCKSLKLAIIKIAYT